VSDAAKVARRVAGALRAGFEHTRRRVVRRARSLVPRSPLHWASVVLIWCVALAWLARFCLGNSAALFDPWIQPNDARTAIFPFHRYDEGAPLADDPISNEMLEYQPYAYRLLFVLTVPFVGLLSAAKIAQAVLILTLVAAGVVLMTSRRAGLGAGLFLIFLFLHDSSVQNRIFGGLPRGFGFPTAALWMAGALAMRPRVRKSAALLAALTYPTALAMVLAAEGVYALRGVHRPGFSTLKRRLLHYALLVVACVVLLAPAVFLGMADGGPVHTLEQAQKEPAFWQTGRLWILPFTSPSKAFGGAFLGAFRHVGDSPWNALKDRLDLYEPEVAIVITAVLLALPLFRLSAGVTPILAFLVGTLVVYAASRVYAFRLYSPERYYTIGMRAVALGLTAATIGLVAPRLRIALRQPLRNLVCTLAIGFAWLGLGDGVQKPQFGLAENYQTEAPLWRFISSLPRDARIASHIMDGDSIPLFTARANNGAFETLQPWLTKSWARQKARSQDTLNALYATREDEVLKYARKYDVSHLLLNRRRYGENFARASRSFEPFTSYAKNLLRDRTRAELVLANLPDEAVVFRYRQWVLVSVEKLDRAWRREKP
jgi:hypothetical protein